MDLFTALAIPMDSDCVHQDFDDYDLHGTRMIEDSNNSFNDIDLH